jgi:hypothetical protein
MEEKTGQQGRKMQEKAGSKADRAGLWIRRQVAEAEVQGSNPGLGLPSAVLSKS